LLKGLPWLQQAEMIKRTAEPPKARKKAIEEAALTQATLHEDPTATAFGCKCGPK